MLSLWLTSSPRTKRKEQEKEGTFHITLCTEGTWVPHGGKDTKYFIGGGVMKTARFRAGEREAGTPVLRGAGVLWA